MHGMPIAFNVTQAHEQLANDLTICAAQARQYGLEDAVGYCMAAAQAPDLLTVDVTHFDAAVLAFVREAASPPARILDVASGTGHFGIPLASQGFEVALFDPASAFLEDAQSRAAPAALMNIKSLICGTFEDLVEIPSESYDVCLCMYAFSYARSRGSAVEAIAQMARIARRAVAVSVMSKEGLIRRLEAEGFDVSPEVINQVRETGVTPPAKPEGGCVVYSCFSLGELREALAEAGLAIASSMARLPSA